MNSEDFKDLKPGKRYRGSGMVDGNGDFQFRRYNQGFGNPNGQPDERIISEDENCQIWKYKDKIQIKLNIPLKEVTATKVFILITKQMNFINKYLFSKTTTT